MFTCSTSIDGRPYAHHVLVTCKYGTNLCAFLIYARHNYVKRQHIRLTYMTLRSYKVFLSHMKGHSSCAFGVGLYSFFLAPKQRSVPHMDVVSKRPLSCMTRIGIGQSNPNLRLELDADCGVELRRICRTSLFKHHTNTSHCENTLLATYIHIRYE